ncbi:hypothetical protein QBZ16_004920 [Prototheca wickerhamii]|uniref:Uncharacterized protein n=1 Tax=Prototheca wickerhamii TaxID=3111 RepID=A0AAD9IF75_PROWI|nr:hypothetical protein QBZ16_004920 [Prototheca wickerhamii]
MVEPCLGNGLVAPAGSGIDDAAWAQLMEDLSSSLSDDDCIVGESLLLPEYEGESRNMELVRGALPDEEAADEKSSDEEAGDSYASSLADIFEDSESTIEELLTEFESSISDVFGDPEASDDELLIPAEGGLPDLFYGALPSVHMTLDEASSICSEDMHEDDGAAEGAGSTDDQALAPVAGDNCAASEEAEREARLDRLTERLNALLSSITYLEDRAGPRQ